MSRARNVISAFEFDRRTFLQMLRRLERLNDVARDGHLIEATLRTPAEVAAWLQAIANAAQEAIREVDARATWLNAVAEKTGIPVDRDLDARIDPSHANSHRSQCCLGIHPL